LVVALKTELSTAPSTAPSTEPRTSIAETEWIVAAF
jgi:hypothetical protein